MSIETTIASLIEDGKEVEAKELQVALDAKKVEPVGTKELKEAKAAQARILEEKKKVLEKNQALELAMEDLKNADLSETEKSSKALEKLQAEKEKLESDLGEITKLSATNQREYRLDKISSKLKFLDSVPSDMRDYAVRQAFQDVEDLNDKESVKSTLERFVESHKGVLASDTTATGSGSTASNSQVSNLSNKSPDKMTIDERAKIIADKQDARRKI